MKIDLTGMIFGRLTVIKRDEKNRKKWICKCSCSIPPIIKSFAGGNLRSGTTTSCGCLRSEQSRLRAKKYNEYDLSGGYGIGWDRMGKGEFYFDLEDYDKIKEYCWCFMGSGYLTGKTPGTNKYILMHRLVMGFPDSDIDHDNRVRYDNRKENLRMASKKENARNRSTPSNCSSGVSGVCSSRNNAWRAYITENGEQIFLGVYKEFEDAVRERLNAELKYYGRDFSPQRHLFKKYGI